MSNIFDQIQNFGGVQKDFENARRAVTAKARVENTAAEVISGLKNLAEGEQTKRGLAAQIIGKFGGTEGLRPSPERRMLNAAIEERNRVQRQLSLLGFSDGESLFQAVEAAQIRMEAEERRKQRLEDIRNMKFELVKPEIKIENISIEIHRHGKEDAE